MDADSKNKDWNRIDRRHIDKAGWQDHAVLPKNHPLCNSQETDKCFVDGNSCKNCVSLEMF